MSEESRQKEGRGLVEHKQVEAPSNFIAGRPKATLLFFGSFGIRCGLWLFIVLLVRYK